MYYAHRIDARVIKVELSEPGYPSLVGGRGEPKPAKPVACIGLVGSNPTPGAIRSPMHLYF